MPPKSKPSATSKAVVPDAAASAEPEAEEAAAAATTAEPETVAKSPAKRASRAKAKVTTPEPVAEAAPDAEAAPGPEAATAGPEAATAGPEAATAGPEAATAGPEDAPDAEAVESSASPEAAEPASVPSDDKSAAAPARGKPRMALDQLVVGTQTKGKVVGLSKFGAFVDVGAVTDGLVHISELSDRRVHRVEDIVKSGDAVDVWVKEVDLNTGRISLSMRRKPLLPMDNLEAGTVVTGTVTSLAKYGAFVDIGAETEGLVHISELSSGYVGDPKDVVKPGQSVEVRVKEVDKAKNRISLSMKGLSDDHGQPAPSQTAKPAPAAREEPEVPAERAPTVVELALRKALGKDDDPGAERAATPAAKEADAGRGAPADLGEVYAKMLEEYRAQKSQD